MTPPPMMPLLAFQDVAKSFTLHLRGGAVLPVIAGATLAVHPGECVVLGGASGAGKSSLLKMAYGNYRCATGAGIEGGLEPQVAHARAGDLLARLNLPERLWALPPATFSGGEQQRVNIARGLIADRPILLLDEPTASLDARNRAVVVDLIAEKRAAGAGILGIFHDADVREAVATRIVDVAAFCGAMAA
jgi:alpha-D-ribose 1-methylphosphonate 5-triphosphate synthase subunit PhnL